MPMVARPHSLPFDEIVPGESPAVAAAAEPWIEPVRPAPPVLAIVAGAVLTVTRTLPVIDSLASSHCRGDRQSADLVGPELGEPDVPVRPLQDAVHDGLPRRHPEECDRDIREVPGRGGMDGLVDPDDVIG